MGRMGGEEAVQTREEVQAEKKCIPGVHTGGRSVKRRKLQKEGKLQRNGKKCKNGENLQKREEEQNRKQCAKREAYS
jgi:competence protein ComGC